MHKIKINSVLRCSRSVFGRRRLRAEFREPSGVDAGTDTGESTTDATRGRKAVRRYEGIGRNIRRGIGVEP